MFAGLVIVVGLAVQTEPSNKEVVDGIVMELKAAKKSGALTTPNLTVQVHRGTVLVSGEVSSAAAADVVLKAVTSKQKPRRVQLDLVIGPQKTEPPTFTPPLYHTAWPRGAAAARIRTLYWQDGQWLPRDAFGPSNR